MKNNFELCGISGQPLDDCDGTHEGECQWQCGACGGNVYNCICEQEEDDTVWCSDCGKQEVLANGLCADCLPKVQVMLTNESLKDCPEGHGPLFDDGGILFCPICKHTVST